MQQQQKGEGDANDELEARRVACYASQEPQTRSLPTMFHTLSRAPFFFWVIVTRICQCLYTLELLLLCERNHCTGRTLKSNLLWLLLIF